MQVQAGLVDLRFDIFDGLPEPDRVGGSVHLHAWREVEQRVDVAVYQRHLHDLDILYGAADLGIGGVHQRRVALYDDVLAGNPDLQYGIHADVGANVYRHAALGEGSEAGRLRFDAVLADRKKLNQVLP